MNIKPPNNSGEILFAIGFCLILVACIGYIMATCNGCTNDTTKNSDKSEGYQLIQSNQCKLPIDGHTYFTTTNHIYGDPNLCNLFEPIIPTDMLWVFVNEGTETDNCYVEPDIISDDKCTIKSSAWCDTGISIHTTNQYESKGRYKGEILLDDNSIYQCKWTYTATE